MEMRRHPERLSPHTAPKNPRKTVASGGFHILVLSVDAGFSPDSKKKKMHFFFLMRRTFWKLKISVLKEKYQKVLALTKETSG